MSQAGARNKKAVWLAGAALVLAIAAVYAPSLENGFISVDDNLYVTHNGHLEDGLSWSNVRWAFSSFEVSNWHPATWMSLMLDHQISGTDPASYHLTNILLHALNSILLLLVLHQLTGALYRSVFVAALFALHPLHVESVAWISERKDVLCALFWLLGILAYVAYVGKRTAGRYGMVLACFLTGLMAKPMLVSFPLTLLLVDFWRKRQPSLKGRETRAFSMLILEKAPLFAISIVSSFVTFRAQKAGGAVAQMSALPLADRVSNAAVSYVLYLWKMIWPVNLALYYPLGMGGLNAWEIVACLMLLSGTTYLAWRAASGHAYITFGWFWYLITLAPVIGIVQIGSQALADRYTYVPLIGIFVIISWGVPDLMGRRLTLGTESGTFPKRALVSLACVILLALAVLARRQVGFWKDDITAWRHAVEVTGENAMSEYNLGLALHEVRQEDEAAVHFAKAVRIDPQRTEGFNNLALILLGQGRYGDAEAALQSALRARPDWAAAQSNMGLLLCRMKRFAEGFGHYEAAVRLDPDDTEIRAGFALSRCDYGIDLASRGLTDDAIRQFKTALEIAPKSASSMVHYDLGVTYAGLNRPDLAKAEYEAAILADPNAAEAHNNLGILLVQEGKVDDAIEHFNAALKVRPDLKTAADSLRIYSEARSKARIQK